MKNNSVSNLLIILCTLTTTVLSAQSWSLSGNAVSSTNFLGTTNNQPLVFKVNNNFAGIIHPGLFNAAYGNGALKQNTTGNFNTAVGNNALNFNGSGAENTACGANALTGNISGSFNTALGSGALNGNKASSNTAVGHTALQMTTTGSTNVAVGSKALRLNTIGNANTAIGTGSLTNNSTGSGNTAAGQDALNKNTTGTENVAVGITSLFDNTTGQKNTAVGVFAMGNRTTGSNNTSIGASAGSTLVGSRSNVTCIGAQSGFSSTNSNEVCIGNTSITKISGQVSFSTFSDGRIKDNIRANVPGLEFINRLRPVTYNLNVHRQNAILNPGVRDTLQWEGKYDIEQMTMTGFIAQEVEKAALDSKFDFSGVSKPSGPDGLYSLRYAEFTVPLVKSVQELNVLLETEQEKNAALEAKVADLESRLARMETMLNTIASERQQPDFYAIAAVTTVVSPNPTTGLVNISLNNTGTAQSVTVKVLDAAGREVAGRSVNGESSVQFDLSQLPAGVYVAQVIADGKVASSAKVQLVK